MLRCRCVFFCGIVWGLLAPMCVVAQTDLRFQWKDNDQQVYTVDQSVRQTLEVFGTRSDTEVRELEQRVRKLRATDEPGEFRIDQRSELLTYRLFSGDTIQFVFDSSQPDGEDPLKRMTQLRRVLAARSQAVWSALIDTEGLRVKSVEGFDTVLEQLELPVASQLADSFAPEYLIAKETDWFHAFPLEPVEMGESWSRRVEHRLGDGQRLQLSYRYTYAGRELRQGQTLERIDVVVDEASWSIDGEAEVPFAIKPQTLKILASNGSLLFNSAAGRVESFRVMVQLRGSISFELGATTDSAQIDLELNRTVQRRAETTP